MNNKLTTGNGGAGTIVINEYHHIHPGLDRLLRKLKIVKGAQIIWTADGSGHIGPLNVNRPANIYSVKIIGGGGSGAGTKK